MKNQPVFSQKLIISTLYDLFTACRNYLVQFILDEQNSENFRTNLNKFLLWMEFCYLLQKHGAFNQDPAYLLTKYGEIEESAELQEIFPSFGIFLSYFLQRLLKKSNTPYIEDKRNEFLGEIFPLDFRFLSIDRDNDPILLIPANFPDAAFYRPTFEPKVSMKLNSRSLKKQLADELPILQFFQMQDIFVSGIDEFVIGAVFEKLLTENEKKNTGSYYTPKFICDFITRKSLDNYFRKIVALKFPKIDIPNEMLWESLDANTNPFSPQIKEFLSETLPTLKIIDPAMGSGHFILSILEQLNDIYQRVSDENSFDFLQYTLFFLQHNIFGIDINSDAIFAAKLRILLYCFQKTNYSLETFLQISPESFHIETEDSLIGKDWNQLFNINPPLSSNVKEISTGPFSIILGNPPYGNLLSPTDKEICQRYASFPNEIASVFIERALDYLAPQGILAFIITFAITFSKDLSKTRLKLAQQFEACYIASFDRDKCRFFEGMTQSVSILMAIAHRDAILIPELNASDLGHIFTTEMHRVMPDLTQLEYQPADKLLLGKKVGSNYWDSHRLPKLGSPKTTQILQKILFRSPRYETLGDLCGSFQSAMDPNNSFNSDINRIWIRISGNYWYNAWDHAPYIGTQIVSFMPDPDDPIVRAFILLLCNSSFFYWWFRVYSDGRHMNGDIMRAIPLPTEFERKMNEICPFLVQFQSILMEIMFQHYDSEHQRFLSSKFKGVIDACDLILKQLYELSDDEYAFIINFETRIRGGKQISDEIEAQIENILKNPSSESEIDTLKKALQKLID